MVVYLDLDKVTLFGGERVKNRLVVDSMIKGIMQGDEFPAVPVCKTGDKEYCLDYGQEDNPGDVNDDLMGVPSKDGGHHRAIAHYLTFASLKCRLVPEEEHVSPPRLVEIKDISLVVDEEDYELRKESFKKYR